MNGGNKFNLITNNLKEVNMSIFWFVLWSCSSDKPNVDCVQITESLKRDSCYHEEIKTMSGKELSKVIEKAKKIEDIIIRGAAVEGWMVEHLKDINPKKGGELCALLDGRAMSYCQRRLSSPHLNR